MTFEEFIKSIVFKANGQMIFRDSLNVDDFVNRYRLNGNKVEHYEQWYRYRIAFQKRNFLTSKMNGRFAARSQLCNNFLPL